LVASKNQSRTAQASRLAVRNKVTEIVGRCARADGFDAPTAAYMQNLARYYMSLPGDIALPAWMNSAEQAKYSDYVARILASLILANPSWVNVLHAQRCRRWLPQVLAALPRQE
jgi:hypothetical protein